LVRRESFEKKEKWSNDQRIKRVWITSRRMGDVFAWEHLKCFGEVLGLDDYAGFVGVKIGATH
jgi:hypothetical protein